MIEKALIPTFPGRPSVLRTRDGVSFYISIHDAGFKTEARRLYAQMCRKHPDKYPRGGTKMFSIHKSILAHYLAREYVWYSKVGLEPPNWHKWRSLAAGVVHLNYHRVDLGEKLDYIMGSY